MQVARCQLFRQSGTFAERRCSKLRAMDSGDVLQLGSGKGHLYFKKDLMIPQRLLKTGKQGEGKPSTVYTVRLSTGFARGAGLQEPDAGVLVCLVGKDGSALLHRFPPFNDPVETESEMKAICQAIDAEDVGVNCKAILNRSRPIDSRVKQRFQEGCVDEASFLGPDLGPLASLMVAPENGTWMLDEASVASSRLRSKDMDRFVCREFLGGKSQRVAYMSPVPANSVVYGTGDSAVILSKEQAQALYSMGMADYGQLKERLLISTAVLVCAGSGIALSTGGWDAACPFAVGGTIGIMYQWMLQKGVDAIPAPFQPAQGDPFAQQIGMTGARKVMDQALGSPAVRMMAVTSTAVCAVLMLLGLSFTEPEFHSSPNQMKQVLTGILGFLMYKLAVIGVASTPSEPSDKTVVNKNA